MRIFSFYKLKLTIFQYIKKISEIRSVKRMLSILFHYAALLFILLHAIVPHAHANEMNEAEHATLHQQTEHSPLDILSLLFHEFTEEGSLEEFVRNEASQSTVFLSAFWPIQAYITQAQVQLTRPFVRIPKLPEKTKKLTGLHYATCHSVRPPPVV